MAHPGIFEGKESKNNMSVLYIDVDGTMTWDGTKKWGPPRQEIMELVTSARLAGHTVIFWSAQGGDYARAFARYHHLMAHAYLSKPDLAVDDCETIRPADKMTIIPPEQLKEFLVKQNGP